MEHIGAYPVTPVPRDPCFQHHHLTDHIRSLGVFDVLYLIGELEGVEILLLAKNLGQVGKCVLE